MAKIPKAGITTAGTIQAEHLTRIIDSLDGTGSYDVYATGSFTGSFTGDGTNITGVTGEWDGTHVGDAEITGMLKLPNAIASSTTNAALWINGVNGAILMDDSAQKRISWNDGGGNLNLWAGGYYNGGNLYVKTGDGAIRMLLNSDGDDGAFSLSAAVTGSAGSPITFANQMRLDTTATTFNVVGNDVDFIVKSQTNDNMLHVKGSTDRVGIGTGTPSETLQVEGNIRFGDGIASSDILFEPTSGNIPKLNYLTGTGFTLNGQANDSITFSEGGNPFVTLEGSNGRVGIGTTTPNYKLEVVGDIRVSTDALIDGDLNVSGQITASGNVSSSLTSTASFGTYLGDGSQLTGILSGLWTGSAAKISREGDVEITGSLTVTSDISSSGDINAQNFYGGVGGRIYPDSSQTSNSQFFNADANGIISRASFEVKGDITASGDISSSSTVFGEEIDANSLIKLGGDSVRMAYYPPTNNLRLYGGNGLEIGSSGNMILSGTGNITASGDISSSGDISGARLSAAGFVATPEIRNGIGTSLLVNDDLNVAGSITASYIAGTPSTNGGTTKILARPGYKTLNLNPLPPTALSQSGIYPGMLTTLDGAGQVGSANFDLPLLGNTSAGDSFTFICIGKSEGIVRIDSVDGAVMQGTIVGLDGAAGSQHSFVNMTKLQIASDKMNPGDKITVTNVRTKWHFEAVCLNGASYVAS